MLINKKISGGPSSQRGPVLGPVLVNGGPYVEPTESAGGHP